MTQLFRRTCLAPVLTGALVAAAAGLPAGTASAAVPAVAPETVRADVLPTVQVNGVVWKTEIVGNTVYAVGAFTKARPAGAPAGSPLEVTRNNVLAFDLTTGALLPFAPNLSAQALTVAASPDGATVYVGGDFTTVDGVVRSKLAAFDTATGALSATFKPAIGAQVRAIAATDTAVYVGGTFLKANNVTRTRLAAFSRANGALLPWAPTAEKQVEALAVSPTDATRVVVGGRFQTLNGLLQPGVGAVDSTTGATAPWSSRPVPAASGTASSWVTDFSVVDGVVYASANGEGGHWFDGRFAADFSTGDLVWLDNCYGATYGIQTMGSVVYSVGHAHDCSSVAGFPEGNKRTYHRTLAETSYAVGNDATPPGSNSNYSAQPVPALLPWLPTLAVGSYTGQGQAAWAVSGNGQYLVEGGEFPSVNGVPQQGLVRFAMRGTAPDKVKPTYAASLIPATVSLAPGSMRVSWASTWDMDDATLRYDLYRDAGTTPIATVTQTATGWTQVAPTVPTGPAMSFTDTGLVPGSSHQYRIKVSDPSGNATSTVKSAPAVVTTTAPSAYVTGVLADAPTAFWQLGETGTAAYDTAAVNDGTHAAGVVSGGPGSGQDGGTASTYNGTTTGLTATSATVAPTPSFSVEAWVKTTTTRGGKVVGYGNTRTGSSGSYDRHVYMDNAGRLVFGVYDGSTRTISTLGSYNDGQYHHVVATLDATAGTALYVDGRLVASDATARTAQAYTGYWRIGGDNLSGWPASPLSPYFAGTIDDVAVYGTALSADTVARHYTSSGRVLPATRR